ncbi:BadF/BadG/BcrA/BcrD ATPase family protein [Ideonella sp.]|uniref:BadF/BadG/BcrA/BcrD ATPase family protein n=1 Tax=Ideonella sp. TaxID=1929293 RepID=UPI0037BFA41C
MSHPPPSLPPYLIGIDGGGTGTRARLVSSDGRVLAHGAAGPSGLSQGVEQAWRHVQHAIAQAFAAAQLPLATPGDCALGLGLAGAISPARAEAFLQAAPPYALLALESDAATALRGAHAGQPGVVLAFGTGSVGEALLADGRKLSVGGWGFPSGDEGSGAWLGLRAVQIAQQALDGRRLAGALAQAVWQATGAGRQALLEWCGSAGQRAYASLAPLVFDAAEADPAASRLLQEAVNALIQMAQALDASGRLPLVITGSVGQRLLPLLPHELLDRCVPSAGDAADGALQLVRERLAHRPR